jgi:hypothetical protein
MSAPQIKTVHLLDALQLLMSAGKLMHFEPKRFFLNHTLYWFFLLIEILITFNIKVRADHSGHGA